MYNVITQTLIDLYCIGLMIVLMGGEFRLSLPLLSTTLD